MNRSPYVLFPFAFIRIKLRLILLLSIFTTSSTSTLFAEPDPRIPEEIAALDRDTQSAWRSFSTRFSGHGAEFNGVYYICFDYDRRYDSSTRLSSREVRRTLTRKVQNGLATQEYEPPDAEVAAACDLLPDLGIGSYGEVYAVTVREVLGPRDVVVTGLKLVDDEAVNDAYREMQRRAGAANRDAVEWAFSQRRAAVVRQSESGYRGRFRLVGFDTEGLFNNRDWDGPTGEPFRVAVVGREHNNERLNPDPRLILAPLEAFRFGLNERQFLALLRQRGVGPADFVEQVRETRREYGRDGDAVVARELMSLHAEPIAELFQPPTPDPPAVAPAATQPQE